jgi:hypothetical protein
MSNDICWYRFLFPADKVSIRNEQDSNHIMWVESTSSSVLLDTLSEALKLESHQIVNLGTVSSIYSAFKPYKLQYYRRLLFYIY